MVIRKRRALRRAVYELHGFIVAHLDAHPAPVEDYITDPAAQAVAKPCTALRLDADYQLFVKRPSLWTRRERAGGPERRSER